MKKAMRVLLVVAMLAAFTAVIGATANAQTTSTYSFQEECGGDGFVVTGTASGEALDYTLVVIEANLGSGATRTNYALAYWGGSTSELAFVVPGERLYSFYLAYINGDGGETLIDPLDGTGDSGINLDGMTADECEEPPANDKTNTPEYWENYFSEYNARCWKHDPNDSAAHGSVTNGGTAVTLNPFGENWYGDGYVGLVVKGGSVDYGYGPGNALYTFPSAGVSYLAPLNAGGQQSEVSHWIVCKGDIPVTTTTTTEPVTTTTTTMGTTTTTVAETTTTVADSTTTTVADTTSTTETPTTTEAPTTTVTDTTVPPSNGDAGGPLDNPWMVIGGLLAAGVAVLGGAWLVGDRKEAR